MVQPSAWALPDDGVVPVPRSGQRPGGVAGVCRSPSGGGVRRAWSRWGEKPFPAPAPTRTAHPDRPDSPMEVYRGLALGQQGTEVETWRLGVSGLTRRPVPLPGPSAPRSARLPPPFFPHLRSQKGVVRQGAVGIPETQTVSTGNASNTSRRPPMRFASGLPTASADKTGASKHTLAPVYPTSGKGS